MTDTSMNEEQIEIRQPLSGQERSRYLSVSESERLGLAAARICEIAQDASLTRIGAPYREYFHRQANFLLDCMDVFAAIGSGAEAELDLEALAAQNRSLYEDILPENYAHSYGNPTYACAKLGREIGQLLSFLYMELQGMIVYVFENKKWDILISLELFLEVFRLFDDACMDASNLDADEAETIDPESRAYRELAERLRHILYWNMSDYSREITDQRTREAVDPEVSFARDIIMKEDLSDLRYLYRFGEYITENEIRTAQYLNSLSEEEIDAIAATWTEGYRKGFAMTGKDISKKKSVNIRFRTGFERVVRSAVKQFEEMGLASIIYRSATHVVSKRQHVRVGYYGAQPNPQFEYDHRNDAAVFTDEKYITRKLQDLENAYKHYETLANGHGGPAVMEVFGEVPFTPEANADAMTMTEEQQKLMVRFSNEAGQITNRYIIGSERSFTIIAYPVPAIGEKFEEIFHETEKINNLEYNKYLQIQQKLIDALDEGCAVHIQGMRGNETDLTVQLHTLTDPAHQTNFENCVADVNIPVGEVFTSPILAGTNGVLHVSKVYLEEFQYRNLKITVKDGMIADYSCSNFAGEEDNRKYIEENILFHHKTIPMGECAIGTNTTAYRMAKQFGIADKLPILIAEKMGPHFAFGDTCYSWEEDNVVYNPDGKEIIARDNEVSLNRKTDVSKAYFGCHTDITIPYEELGSIRVLRADGSHISLIENGRFVLPGTEELNAPLEGIL